jgi:hypothetical protein
MYGGYRAVFSTIWTEETGQEWNRLGHQYHKVAFYLLTGPMSNAYGLYYLPLAVAAEQTALTAGQLTKIFEVFDRQQFAHYDAQTQWVWVRNMVRYQLAPNGSAINPADKRLNGVRRFYDTCIPNNHLGPFFDLYAGELGLPMRREKKRPVASEPRESAPTGEGSPAVGQALVVREHRMTKADLFERWWQHYPKKVGKKTALEEWMRIPGVDEQFTARAIATLEWQRRTPEWVKENGQYIVDPERYLKRGRWSDEPRDSAGVTDRDLRTANVLSDWAAGGGV